MDKMNKNPGKRTDNKMLSGGMPNNNSKMGNITQKWVNNLQPFAEDYAARLTASLLSKKTGIPQQTASRCLNSLVKSSLINYCIEGRNKLFYFDLKKQSTRNIFAMIENHKSLDFQVRNKKMAVMIDDILDWCDALVVFGSYASYTAHADSDLDVVIFNGDKKRIKEAIEKQPVEIHAHHILFSEFYSLLKSKNALAIEIMDNHILFGDISKLVDIFLRWFNGRR